MSDRGAALLADARKVSAEIRSHKQAQRRHRQAARAAAERLAGIEAECARLGIRFIRVPG